MECLIFTNRIKRITFNNLSKYKHPDNLEIVMGNKVERMKYLLRREWDHSIWDSKFKRPECGYHKIIHLNLYTYIEIT